MFHEQRRPPAPTPTPSAPRQVHGQPGGDAVHRAGPRPAGQTHPAHPLLQPVRPCGVGGVCVSPRPLARPPARRTLIYSPLIRSLLLHSLAQLPGPVRAVPVRLPGGPYRRYRSHLGEAAGARQRHDLGGRGVVRDVGDFPLPPKSPLKGRQDAFLYPAVPCCTALRRGPVLRGLAGGWGRGGACWSG